MGLPNPWLFLLAIGSSSALGSFLGYRRRSPHWRMFGFAGGAGIGLAEPFVMVLYGFKLLSFDQAFWLGASILFIAVFLVSFATMRAHLLDAIRKRRRSLPLEAQLELIRRASNPAETANPSVKGTSRKRAAPYVER